MSHAVKCPGRCGTVIETCDCDAGEDHFDGVLCRWCEDDEEQRPYPERDVSAQPGGGDWLA